jgi:hypothetical protein
MTVPRTSLLFVHRVMITLAILFCAFLFARQTALAVRDGDPAAMIVAAISGIGAVSLGVYLRWWLRKLR